jgi:predicted membrane-bound dolichyl-phosphate-mannose-protein mannosyltransferase
MPVNDNNKPRTTRIISGEPRLHSFLQWFTHKENIVVCVIAAIVFGLHLLMISKPAVYVFDEDFYIPAARSFLNGGGLLNPQHAPLGKLFIAAGISIFGNNAVGWRIFSIIFGVASIFIFYLITVQLCRTEIAGDEVTVDSPVPPKKQSWFSMMTFVPVFAAFLFAFENLSFVMAHLAMLDVFYVTFMLLGFLLYLRGNYWWCGVAMALSMLCKIIAFMAILAIVFHWALTRRHEVAAETRHLLRSLRRKKELFHYRALWDMTKILITIFVLWVVLLPLMEYPAAREFFNPISRTIYMLKYHLGVTVAASASPISSQPWSWIIHPTSIIYWPASLAFVSGRFILPINSSNPLYYCSISWNIWILIIPVMLYLTYVVIRSHAVQHNVTVFSLSWFFGVYLLLMPLALVSDRLMFTSYFYPAVPAVCLAIAWSAWKLWSAMRKDNKQRVIFVSLLAVYAVCTIVIFYLMSPFGGHLLFGVHS